MVDARGSDRYRCSSMCGRLAIERAAIDVLHLDQERNPVVSSSSSSSAFFGRLLHRCLGGVGVEEVGCDWLGGVCFVVVLWLLVWLCFVRDRCLGLGLEGFFWAASGSWLPWSAEVVAARKLLKFARMGILSQARFFSHVIVFVCGKHRHVVGCDSEIEGEMSALGCSVLVVVDITVVDISVINVLALEDRVCAGLSPLQRGTACVQSRRSSCCCGQHPIYSCCCCRQ